MQTAVLTGDLVRSTALTAAALEAAFAALAAAAAEIAHWQDADPRFTRSRGDGWQLRLIRPELALRAALYLRASLRASGTGAETRIAIAAGKGGDSAPADLNAATGPVYTASGRALDALGGGARMTHAAGGALGAAVRLADEIAAGWTEAQARSLRLMLPPDPPTRAQAGSTLGITRQAVDQALAGGGFAALDEALRLLEGAPDAS